jgi:F1F0 ATPase subunit 2
MDASAMTAWGISDIVAAGGPLLGAVCGAVVGYGVGALYFGSLRWTAEAWVAGAVVRAVASQIGRLALVAIVLFGLAKIGPAALLCGALGVLAARHVAVRRFGRSP